MALPDTVAEASGEELGSFIRRRCADILSEWERSVRTLPVAGPLSGPRLVDHMPELLYRLAQVVTGRAETLGEFVELDVLERLDESFELSDVATEYRMLRATLLRLFAEEQGPLLPATEVQRLDEAIDEAVVTSVARYASARERTRVGLDRIIEAALESGDVERFLPRLLQVLLESSEPVDTAKLVLREGNLLRVHAALGLDEESTVGATIPVGEGFVGEIARTGQPLELQAAATDPLVMSEPLRRSGVQALYGVPLLEQGNVIGVAVIGSRTAAQFSNTDKMLFRTMVQRATMLLIQARLRDREREARASAEQSLAQVDALLAGAPAGIAFLDPQLRYVRVNAFLATATGYAPQAHVGRTVGEVRGPTLSASFEPLLREVLRDGETKHGIEFSAVSAASPEQLRHWSADYFPVSTQEGRVLGVGGIVTDVTERKRAEQALRESEERFRTLVEATSDIVWTTGPDGEVVTPVPAWMAFTGQAPEQMLGLGWIDAVHPEDHALTHTLWREALARGDFCEGEHRLRRRDGEYRLMHVRAVPVRAPDGTVREWVGVHRDVTEQRRAEETLRRWEQVFSHATLGVITEHADTGRLLELNPAFARMHGYTVEELQGAPLAQLLEPAWVERRPGYREQVDVLGHLQLETLHVRKDGSTFPALDVVTSVRGPDGQVLYRIGNVVDITEQREREQRLAQAAEFRERFVGIVSHDLRSPLTAIGMSASVLLQDEALGERHRRAVGRIAQSSDRMGRMIRDLLDLTRGRLGQGIPIQPRAAHLEVLCRATLEELELAYPTRELRLAARGDLHGTWDADRIAQVLGNLGKNALEYSPQDTPLEVLLEDLGARVRLTVRNQGTPIPPELIPHLFEPFRRGETGRTRASDGLGLGLFIVHLIASAHGGTVEARSEAQEGTRFIVTLPRHSMAAAPARAAGEPA